MSSVRDVMTSSLSGEYQVTGTELEEVLKESGVISGKFDVAIIYSPNSENPGELEEEAKRLGHATSREEGYEINEIEGVESMLNCRPPECRQERPSPLDEANRMLTSMRLEKGDFPDKLLFEPKSGAQELEYDEQSGHYTQPGGNEVYTPEEVSGSSMMSETELEKVISGAGEMSQTVILLAYGDGRCHTKPLSLNTHFQGIDGVA